MSPPVAINLERYDSVDRWSRLIVWASLNLILKHMLDWWSGGPHVHCIDTLWSHPTHQVVQCHLHFKIRAEHSPTWRKTKRRDGYITCGGLRGLASSDNRDAYMYYNPILRVNINMHTCHLRAMQALTWVRVALPCGLACHVASAWVLHNK